MTIKKREERIKELESKKDRALRWVVANGPSSRMEHRIKQYENAINIHRSKIENS